MDRDYLKLWGFHEVDYNKNFNDLKISLKVKKFLKNYITEFPTEIGLVFKGHPRLTTKVMGRVIKELYDNKKFKSRVVLIDIPTHLIRFKFVSFQEHSRREIKLQEDLINSDLVVFQEIGMSPWTSEQQAKLYTLIYERYSRRLPFFCTSTTELGTFERNVGNSNFVRISDVCKFITLLNKDI